MSNAMPAVRVSFDIDDTLVCGPNTPTEQSVPLWRRRRYPEPMRRGTRALMLALIDRGCRIWIYTSSRRPRPYLTGWFGAIGIPLDGVVNLCHHESVVGMRGPSKCPPAFGIHLHVDDSHGVAMEGETHGFNVVVVSPDDAHWGKRVLDAVDCAIGPRIATPLPTMAPFRNWARSVVKQGA
jgi:hypothetical protein